MTSIAARKSDGTMTVLDVFQPWKSQELSPHGSDRTDYAAWMALGTESEEQHGRSAANESAATAKHLENVLPLIQCANFCVDNYDH